jgi:phospholipid/cholesterol/gamma-HCH transport system ATP-binding protein
VRRMAAEVEPVIEVEGLSTWFGPVCVHEEVSFTVAPGAVMGIVGGSGSGKSVLLRHIIMLTRPTHGSVRLFGQEVVGIDTSGADRLRRRFGVMFQQGALFSSQTVLENVAVPLNEHTKLGAGLVRDLAMLKIQLAGLPADAAAKYPRELSGGMLKRAAVARALALDPELLFLDEPSAGLDPVSASALDELIMQLSESLGLTVVMVTHDLDSLWRVTTQVAFLGERHILGLGTMEELAGSEHPLIRHYFQGPRGRAARAAAS